MKSLLKKTYTTFFSIEEFKHHQKISFSQSGEDLIVKYIFSSLNIKNPSYIDIGAYHPYKLSNTALFYLEGSRGICVEPNPDSFELFKEHRPLDINLNMGITEKEQTINYFVMSSSTLNTFSEEEAKSFEKSGQNILEIKKIKTDCITNILNKYNEGKFPDFLSIDVEGYDLKILKSIDFEKSKPKIICAETCNFESFGKGTKNKELIEFILSKEYSIYSDTFLNTIFIDNNLM